MTFTTDFFEPYHRGGGYSWLYAQYSTGNSYINDVIDYMYDDIPSYLIIHLGELISLYEDGQEDSDVFMEKLVECDYEIGEYERIGG